MANVKVSGLSTLNHLTSDDLFLVVNDPQGNPESRKISVGNMFANVAIQTSFNNRVTLNANVVVNSNLSLPTLTPPSSNAFVEGRASGSIWFDSGFVYIAIDQNTIKRVPLESF
jgi:hypothetical protein